MASSVNTGVRGARAAASHRNIFEYAKPRELQDKGKDKDSSSKKSTDAPTASPTFTLTQGPTKLPTRTPTLAPVADPTSPPTFRPTPSTTDAPTLLPTTLPTIDVNYEETLEFLFYLEASSLSIPAQLEALVPILNVALCYAGVDLRTLGFQEDCPDEIARTFYEAVPIDPALSVTDDAKTELSVTKLYKEPLVEATMVDPDVYFWNLTYQVLVTGHPTADVLQSMWRTSIEEARLDQAMAQFWPNTSSNALISYTPINFLPRNTIPGDLAQAMRIIGYFLTAFSLFGVIFFTWLARRFRLRQEENKKLQDHGKWPIAVVRSDDEADPNESLEAMLHQSRMAATNISKPLPAPPSPARQKILLVSAPTKSLLKLSPGNTNDSEEDDKADEELMFPMSDTLASKKMRELRKDHDEQPSLLKTSSEVEEEEPRVL